MTKGILIERILKKLEGGTVSTRGRATRAEVSAELNSVLSSLFRNQIVETNFGDDESIPDGMLLALYEAIPITRRDNGRNMAKLPVAPMVLPRGMGVFSVFPSGYPEKEFIPIKTGFQNLINIHQIVNTLSRKTYHVQGNMVVLNHDAIGSGVTELDMILACFDITHYSETDTLPIPSDMEEAAVIQVCKIFGLVAPIAKAETKEASPTKADV